VAGAVAASLLDAVGVQTFAHVVALGGTETVHASLEPGLLARRFTAQEIVARAFDSPVAVVDDAAAERDMIARIDAAKAAGDTLGGVVEVGAVGVPIGLGSYATADARLDARLAFALMSIPAIKAVEIGHGVQGARARGSELHDAIVRADDGRIVRATNRAGGVEGGVSNGETLAARAHMKPLPTLRTALPSIDLATGEVHVAHKERSDVCAVPACAVVAECMLALVVADALLERYGGDHLAMLVDHVARDRARVDAR